MNYKIHMAFARNSGRRYGAVIGSELWHESSVFRFVDYRALALIMQKLQVNKQAFLMTPETRYGGVTIKILWYY